MINVIEAVAMVISLFMCYNIIKITLKERVFVSWKGYFHF